MNALARLCFAALRSTRLLVIGAVLLLAAPQIRADIVEHSYSDVSGSLTFSLFDPSIGTLTGATFAITNVESQGSISYTNPSGTIGSFDIQFQPQFLGQFQTGLAPGPLLDLSFTTNVIDLNGDVSPNSTASQPWQAFGTPMTYSTTLNGGTSFFVGPGSTAFDVSAGLNFGSQSQTSNLEGPNVGDDLTTYDFSATYTYDPSSPVPEPAYFGVLLMAGIVVSIARLRRIHPAI